MPEREIVVNTDITSIIKNDEKKSLNELNVQISTSKVKEITNTLTQYDTTLLTSENIQEHLGYMWSHIVWFDGKRLCKLFKSAQCFAIDIDNKPTEKGGNYLSLLGAKEICESQELLYAIAPTASHQCDVNKDGKAIQKVDKYRILLFADLPVTDSKQYNKFYHYLVGLFPGSDRSAKDCARHWAPPINKFKKIQDKTPIISCENLSNGYTLKVPTWLLEEKVKNKSKLVGVSGGEPTMQSERVECCNTDESNDKITSISDLYQVLSWIDKGFEPGTGRNNKVFRTIMVLRAHGMKREEIHEKVDPRVTFDSHYPEEKYQKAFEDVFIEKINWTPTKELSIKTAEDLKNLKDRVVAAVLNRELSDYDVENARILVSGNDLIVKTPRLPARRLMRVSAESDCIFIDARMSKSSTPTCNANGENVTLDTIKSGYSVEKISLKDLLKNQRFLSTQVTPVEGEIYYPVCDVIVENCLNTYTAPIYLGKNNDYEADVDLFTKILNTAVNNDKYYFEWMCNWVNHLLRFPHIPLTRHPVILAPQGACKGTFFTVLEGLLGGNTLSIRGDHLLGKESKFNSVSCTKNVLICLDELKMNSSMAPELKRLFKNMHSTNFEEKGVQGFKARRTSNFLILGNVEENVLNGLKSDERAVFPIKWEDSDFVVGSAKYEAALRLFYKLDEKIKPTKYSPRPTMDVQFVSNLYHYFMSLEYSRDKLNAPLNVSQRACISEENLSVMELSFIERIQENKRACFKTTELLKKPDTYSLMNFTQQNDVNEKIKVVNILSKRNKLHDVLRIAGYVQVKTQETARVWVKKQLSHSEPQNLLKWLKEKTKYVEIPDVNGGYILRVEDVEVVVLN